MWVLEGPDEDAYVAGLGGDRVVVVYTCTMCRHISPFRHGTNGHRHHCPGSGLINVDDLSAIRAAYRLGGLTAASDLMNQLNMDRVGYSLPGPL